MNGAGKNERNKVKIILEGPGGRAFTFGCDCVIDGVPVNPDLPENFDRTPNERRPDSHLAWVRVPFIVAYIDSNPDFVKHWKGDTRYDVRCLDGGAWDRSTWWGSYADISEAVNLAKQRKPCYT